MNEVTRSDEAWMVQGVRREEGKSSCQVGMGWFEGMLSLEIAELAMACKRWKTCRRLVKGLLTALGERGRRRKIGRVIKKVLEV